MTDVNVKVKKIRENAVLPVYSSTGAACFDLTACDIVYSGIHNRYATVYLGLAFEVPEGYSLDLKPRSSFTLKGWVMENSPGKIDSDYRGELMLKLEAIPQDISPAGTFIYNKLPFNVGDRCVQGEFKKVIQSKFNLVNELSSTDRGDGGFGSTGKT